MTSANSFNRANALIRARTRIILNVGENSVVNNAQLPRMPRGSCVILSTDVYETMKMISDVTNQIKIEVPFLLFGHSEGQTVYFDVCGCLLTGGNYNFVFYDGNDTYRFDDVFTKGKNGNLRKLQTFGPDIRTLTQINNRTRF